MRLTIKLDREAVHDINPDTGEPIEPPGRKTDILYDTELRDSVDLHGIRVFLEDKLIMQGTFTAVTGWMELTEDTDPDGIDAPAAT